MSKASFWPVDALRDAAERYTENRHARRPMPELDQDRVALWAAALAFADWFQREKDNLADAAAVEQLYQALGRAARATGEGEGR